MTAYTLRTFSDIYNAVIEELKVQATDTVQLNRIRRDINMVYLDEVIPYTSWYWLRRKFDIIHSAYYNTGTAAIVKGSATITLSAVPSTDKTDKLIKINGYSEVYRIIAHSGATLTLEVPYTGATNAAAAYKIWDDGIVLPVDIEETYKVWNDHRAESMEPMNDKEFLELVLSDSELEGRPAYFRVSETQDATPYSTISGLPALSTRASNGIIRTLVFNADVSSYFSVGDSIRVQSAGNTAYNGEFIIEDVSTTTITFIGLIELDETAAADATLTVLTNDQIESNESYRKLLVYPYLNNENTTIHVEGIRRVGALENDNDEPIVPLRDRIVLVYGALHKAWSRQRNPEEASRNFQLFERKLARMAAKIQDSTDFAQLKISRLYLRGRRASRRRYNWYNF